MRTKPIRIKLELLEKLNLIDKDTNLAIAKLLERKSTETDYELIRTIIKEEIEKLRY